MGNKTGSDLVTDALIEAGVEVIFGIISNHTLDLHDSLRREKDRIRYIGGRTELGLGYMADGYARASGRPGVFLTSAGPGAAHSVAPLGEAYFAGSPVLLLTTNVPSNFVGKEKLVTHETRNQPQMFESVTDWNALIRDVREVPSVLAQAFERLQTHRPRSLEIEIPMDLLGPYEGPAPEIGGHSDAAPPAPSDAEIEQAAALLANARRPLIFAGEELHFAPGSEVALVELAELLGAAVVTGEGAKGIFPESHPLSLGQPISRGNWGDNPVAGFVGDCDVVLVLGSCLSHRATTSRGISLSESLIHVTLDRRLIGLNYPAALGIVASCQSTITALTSALSNRPLARSHSFSEEIAEARRSAQKSCAEQFPGELRAFQAIREVLPDDTITAWDFCMPLLTAVRCFPVDGPRRFMFPHGWMSLGFAFPASLGAKLAVPQSPVVCFTGDGGFQYNLQELATAVQHGIAPVVVVFNNGTWGLLERYQNREYGGRTYGVNLTNPNFASLAQAYGIDAVRVDTLDGLCRALSDGITANAIRVIEVMVPEQLEKLP